MVTDYSLYIAYKFSPIAEFLPIGISPPSRVPRRVDGGNFSSLRGLQGPPEGGRREFLISSDEFLFLRNFSPIQAGNFSPVHAGNFSYPLWIALSRNFSTIRGLQGRREFLFQGISLSRNFSFKEFLFQGISLSRNFSFKEFLFQGISLSRNFSFKEFLFLGISLSGNLSVRKFILPPGEAGIFHPSRNSSAREFLLPPGPPGEVGISPTLYEFLFHAIYPSGNLSVREFLLPFMIFHILYDFVLLGIPRRTKSSLPWRPRR